MCNLRTAAARCLARRASPKNIVRVFQQQLTSRLFRFSPRAAFLKEEAQRKEGKIALQKSLLQNEANVQAKAEAKKRESEMNAKFTEEYAAILEKQEHDRKAARLKILNLQVRYGPPTAPPHLVTLCVHD